MLSVPDRSLVPRCVNAVGRVAVVEDPLPSRSAKSFRGPVCLLDRCDASIQWREPDTAAEKGVNRVSREKQHLRVRHRTEPTGQTKFAWAMTADMREEVLPTGGAAEIG